MELSDPQATQLDLLLEAYHALARHSAALERHLAEEGVPSMDTTSWDSGPLCHSLAQSFYSSHGSADTPSRTHTPSSRMPYSPYFSSRPCRRSPPYTLGYFPVASRRGLRLIRTTRKSVGLLRVPLDRFRRNSPRAPIDVSSTDEPTSDASQFEELQ
ncbi:hypothetical protein E2562_036904 [Oryza meyeriana var. granulata]|uniref:Uncharacterized protein n=1 Tax=Oryza meyeriana var. granulata TaxID=110450 RepID=A0A6G1ETF0_9ORYZ|nr:hypothetical protein E2562_036903 [Oryza meyeriana var. granulata]KAF0927928.1 hypothetical protein E2562_036904 [Oryza meyeriana var. granulata]